MRTSDFHYRLPPEMIAQSPVEPRDHSRLLVLGRSDGAVSHRRFFDLPDLLTPGDLVVFNDSRVFPARLYGCNVDSGRPIELLLLAEVEPDVWRTLVKPGRRMRKGAKFVVGGEADGQPNALGEVIAVEEAGSRLVRFDTSPELSEIGVLPLPPYIREPLADTERYQTVYSRAEGSVAAPTAGLHFTSGLLGRLRDRCIETTFVTLHVGWDSFKPVTSEDPAEHRLHSEYWELSEAAAGKISVAKSEGRRVVSIGTTAVRLLENAAICTGSKGRIVNPGSGWVDLFITPGFEFKVIDVLVTNFHLPQSTLLMLVSAFAGRERVLAAYRAAVAEGYRFYSFGDSMLIQ